MLDTARSTAALHKEQYRACIQATDGMLQVTFCPDVPTKAADNVQLLKLPNLQLPLYTHSFLGFGQEAALTLASTAAVSKRLQATSTSPSNLGEAYTGQVRIVTCGQPSNSTKRVLMLGCYLTHNDGTFRYLNPYVTFMSPMPQPLSILLSRTLCCLLLWNMSCSGCRTSVGKVIYFINILPCLGCGGKCGSSEILA